MPTITVDIKAVGGAQFQRSFEQASQVMGRTFPQAARVAEAQVASMTKALELQSQVLARVKSQAVGAFAAYIGVGAVAQATRSIVQSTNALIGWQNALKAVSPDAQAAAAGMTFVRNEADRLGLSLESMAGQFARFSAATRGTALEGEQTRAIFTAMSEASRVLNLSVDGTEGAFRALEQMVSKGKVQAEELRGQLGERLPGAFRMAAEALGVTTEELNKMLELGQVTAENLLPKLAERLRDVYSAAAVNAANSPAAEFNRLSNALFDLRVAVGESGVMEGLTRGAREATDALRGVVDSGAIDRIASGLGTVATAVGLAFGGRSIAAVANYAASVRESVAETVASAKAAESAAIAKNRLAAAEATAAGNAYLYAEQQMRSAIGTKSADMAAKELAAARMAQIRANAALVLSEKELAAAQMQSAASANAASVAASKMAAVGKSVFAMVGGWPTVFLAAGYAAYQMWDSMANGSDEANAALRGLNNIIESNERQLQRLRNAANGVDESISDQITAFRDAGNRIYEYEQRIKMLQIASEDQNRATIVGAGAWSVYQVQLKTAEKDLENATAAMDAAMRSSFELAAAQDKNAAANKQSSANLRTLVDGYLRSGATIDEITAKLEAMGLMQDYVNQLFREAPRAAEQAVEGFDKETQAFIDRMKEQAEEVGKTRAQLVLLRAERQAESAPNQAAKDAIMEQANALARLIEAEESRRLSLRQARADMKDADKAAQDLERSQARWADMIGRVSSGLSDAQKVEEKYQKTMRDSEALAEKLIASGAKRADIEEQLKLIQSDAAQVREQEIAVVNEQAEAAERYIQALMSETAMIGMSYAAAAKLQARLQAEEKMRDEIAKAMKAGKAYTQEQIQAKIKEAGATAAANVELERYVNWLREIGKTDAEVSLAVDGVEGDNIADPIWDAVKASETLKDRLRDAFNVPSIDKLHGDIAKLGELMKNLSEDDEGYAQVRLAYARANVQLLEMQAEKNLAVIGAVGSATQAIAGLFSESEEGQKRAAQLSAALAIAEQAAMVPVLIAKASEAIMTQAAKGDPYSAFARMAMMAAAVAPLLSAVGAALPAFGGGGGGGTNSAAYRQERQGTGTVLGDATAKSESILNAVEITANATEQLVGINRGMLNALQAMQAGISGASGLLARGAGNGVDTSLGRGIGSALSSIPVIGSLLGGALSNIFGGKESLRDQGIRIVGGTLSSMIDDIMVQAYASIHRSGGWFRSSRDYDRFTTLGDDVASQFSLVLGSMADAVRAAADALGLNMDEINARIAAFQIEEIRISTMDLSAEEARKELEAAFSAIFDGLAGHVVPFIEQFQQVGEGMAETLIRVATGVQVTQEAMIQLGFALDETDPERFAQVSEALMDLVGGVDAFIDGMSSFVNSFASEEHKFAVAQDALTRAFAQLGIEIPASRDAMWGLMQAQDAATESGREVIAMLLRLAGVSDSYYDMLEDRAAAIERIGADIAAGAWEQYLDGLEDGQRAIVELTRYYDDWIASATEAGATAEQLAAIEEQRAVAMGRLLEAAEADYQRMLGDLNDEIDTASMTEYTAAMREISRWTAQTTRELNAAARAAGRQSAAEGDLARVHQVAALRAAQALARLQEQAQALAEELYGTPLSRLEDQIAALQETESAAVSAIGGLSDAFSDAARNAAEAMGLLLGSYSPLRASDKLPIALDALARGETDANTVLQIARDVYASGEAYNAVFRQVQAIVASQSTGGDSSGYGGRTTVSAEMQALIAERDALLAEQQAAQRFMQASNLAQMVADLSGARGEGFDTIAESLGFTLEQFAEDLRLEGLDDLTEYLSALQAEQLGFAELFDTPTAGDLEIVDAIDGLRDAIHVPGPDDSVAQERAETLTTLRDVRDALRVIAERGVNANEDAATATERVAEGVERLAVILESDGPADAANRRRGG